MGNGVDLDRFISSQQFRFAYKSLADDKKTAYSAVLRGYLGFECRISVYGVGADGIQDVLTAIRLDIPELFWVKENNVEYNVLMHGSCTVVPSYRFDEKTTIAMLAAMQSVADSLQRSFFGLTEIDLQVAVHDYLVKHFLYGGEDGDYAYEACGPLLYGIGVCEGVAKAYKYLCDRCGLRSIVVVGWAENHKGDQEESEPHAWNISEIGGAYYHQDVTFDASLSDATIRYDYFNLSDDEIVVDHRFDRSHYPPCSASYGYYRKAGLYAASKSELKELVRKEYRPEQPLVFQVPIIQEGEQEFRDRIMRIVGGAVPVLPGCRLPLTLVSNRSRGVYQVSFSEAKRDM